MTLQSFLATLSHSIAIGLEGVPCIAQGHPFWGLNVILCGDLYQFPSVAGERLEALYYPANLTKDSDSAKTGHCIHEEFSTIVALREQMFVTDHE